MKHPLLCAMAIALASPALSAQPDEPKVDIAMDARVDFQNQWVDGETVKDDSGFKGRYLNLMIHGALGDKFSYSFRQRLNKTIEKDSHFFDATDWMYVNYRPVEVVELSAGKQVVAIGGYEYDRAPIDLYFCSEFWNNIPCYQFGVSGAYVTGNDRLMFQVTQSPWHEQNNQYAYNLQWNGRHGVWSTIWSVNMIEYRPKHYINYIALGNRFDLDNVAVELDVMNRASSHGKFLFGDCSVMLEVAWQPLNWLKPFAKFTYDVNHKNTADYCVMPGTEMTCVGAGIEGWPLRKGRNEVRLHADVCYAWGHNPLGVMQDKGLLLNMGVKWRVDIFSRK